MNHFFKIYTMSGGLLLLAAYPGNAQVQDYDSDDVIQREQPAEPLQDSDYPATVETLNDEAAPSSHPFYTSSWIDGQVKLDRGKEYQDVSLRYDIHRNLLLTEENGEAVPIETDEVRSFTLGPPRLANLSWFQRAKYLDGFDEVPDEQFVQVLHEGESKLLAVHHKEAIPGRSAFSPMITDYYYVSPQGEVSSFEPNRESILDVLADKRVAVDNFITDAEIDLDNAADLTRVIIFYDREAK